MGSALPRRHWPRAPSLVVLRLYIDEDSMRRGLAPAIRDVGFDCLTAGEASNRGLSDEEQLAFAASVRRTLFTQNVRDYRMLHFAWAAASRGHGGIVAPGDQRASIGDQIRALGQLDANGVRRGSREPVLLSPELSNVNANPAPVPARSPRSPSHRPQSSTRGCGGACASAQAGPCSGAWRAGR